MGSNYCKNLVYDNCTLSRFDFNPKMTDDSYQEKFPYVITREVNLRNVSTSSGIALRISDNLFMFKDVKVDYDKHSMQVVQR